jgi:hypothetical protein
VGWIKRLIGGPDAPRPAGAAAGSQSYPHDDRVFDTGADETLQRDVFTNLLMIAGAHSQRLGLPPCANIRMEGVVRLDESAWPADWRIRSGVPAGLPGGPGTRCELWSLDFCGMTMRFAVGFAPDTNGGTNIAIRGPGWA